MNLIHKLGIGTVQFGMNYGISNNYGKTDISEVKSILDFADEVGIKTIDTAHSYGDSEVVLGQSDLSGFEIVSKFNGNSVFELNDQLETTLAHLQLKSIYAFLSHNVSCLINNFDLWHGLQKLKEQGVVKKIGFSMNAIEEISEIKKMGIKPDLIQIPFNILDNRFVKFASELKNEGSEIHSRSAFLQGLLFCDTEKLNPFFEPVRNVILQLQKLENSLPASLLKYCLQKDFIDKVIFGVNTKNQFIQNLKNIGTAVDIKQINLQISDKILTPSEWPI